MTNPTEPRWIPAAEKPGGLVRGDVIKDGDEEGIVLIPGSAIHPPRNALCWFNPEGINDHSDGGDSYTIEVFPENLLVRIDPLPESTEAFREGAEIIRSKADELMAESEALEAQLDDANTIEEFSRKRDRRWILYHRSIDFRRAAKLIDPTPTEAADESSNHV